MTADGAPSFPAQLRLDGRVAVVLGAGSGIGRSTAHALAQAGAHVVCADVDGNQAAEVAGEIGGLGLAADITNRDEIEGVLEQAGHAGTVTGVVDIVGMAMIKALEDVTDDEWDRQMDLVLRHAFRVAQIGGRALADSGGGSMVFVGSVAGHTYVPSQAVYGAGKAALHHLVRAVAREFGARHVRANVVAPGPIRTPRLEERLTADQWASFGRAIPRGRVGTPEEIAAVVLFLLSDLSSYVSGQVLTADGGWSGAVASPI